MNNSQVRLLQEGAFGESSLKSLASVSSSEAILKVPDEGGGGGGVIGGGGGSGASSFLSNSSPFSVLHPRVSFPAYVFIILLSEVGVFEKFEGGGQKIYFFKCSQPSIPRGGNRLLSRGCAAMSHYHDSLHLPPPPSPRTILFL